jgi:transposase, IS30 family
MTAWGSIACHHCPQQDHGQRPRTALLRQYMPKGTDLSKLSAEDLVRIQRSCNGRLRKPLGYMTRLEKFAEVRCAHVLNPPILLR